MNEKLVEEIVKADLDKRYAYYKKKQGNLYQTTGDPDFDCCVNGLFIGIETKARNRHKLSMAQIFEGFKIVASGGCYIVAYEDYTTMEKLPIKRFKLSEKAKQAKNAVDLDENDYEILEGYWDSINQTKESVMFSDCESQQFCDIVSV